MVVYSYLFDTTKYPSMPVMDVKLIDPASGGLNYLTFTVDGPAGVVEVPA
jgi:hypothetical protein